MTEEEVATAIKMLDEAGADVEIKMNPSGGLVYVIYADVDKMKESVA